MPELVNATAKSQLDSGRNQEPTHLGGASYETVGGPGVTSEPNGPDYKIDAAKGVSTDTTIPKSVAAEPSHLKTEDDDADVSFDDEVTESDDIDAELDKFDEADVDVELQKEDDDDEEEKVNEEDEDDKDKVNESDDEEKVDEDDDEEQKVDESDDEEKDGDKPAFLTKEDDEDDEDNKDLKESARVKIRIKVPAIKLNESVIPAKNQKKVTTLFEQAIRQTTKDVSKQLHKHYKALFEQKIARHQTALEKQVDGYLNYAVNEWVKDNKVAIRTSLRTSLAEEFLSGLQKLMKEHYIDVPESKVDVVKQLQSQLAATTKKLNEQTAKTMKVRKLAEEANKQRIVAQFSRGLSEAQAAKLSKLAESTKYTNSKDFKQALVVLKETYFPKGEKKVKTLAEETIVVPKESKKEETASTDPLIAATMSALKAQNDANRW